MFSNGKFKNIVAEESILEPLGPDTRFNRIFELLPVRTPTKNWIAVEGALFNTTAAASTEAANSWNDHTRLAPSSPPEVRSAEDRNVFAIYVSYYVKVKLTLSGMGGEVSLKLPFLLGHVDDDNNKDIEDFVAPNGQSALGVQKSPARTVVVPVTAAETQCEVISEFCEMSLSNNNNLSPSHKRTMGTGEGATNNDCPSIKDNVDIHGESGTLDNVFPPSGRNGEAARVDRSLLAGDNGRTKTRGELEDGDDDDEDNNVHPVISVATVHVHAPDSRHNDSVADLE